MRIPKANQAGIQDPFVAATFPLRSDHLRSYHHTGDASYYSRQRACKLFFYKKFANSGKSFICFGNGHARMG
jgi:hypothetical protein